MYEIEKKNVIYIRTIYCHIWACDLAKNTT